MGSYKAFFQLAFLREKQVEAVTTLYYIVVMYTILVYIKSYQLVYNRCTPIHTNLVCNTI
jgi:hypothetical protein